MLWLMIVSSALPRDDGDDLHDDGDEVALPDDTGGDDDNVCPDPYDIAHPDGVGRSDLDALTTSRSSKKGSRGLVTMLSVKKAKSKGKKVEVGFNELGQPIGKGSTKLSYYLGVVVREVIPIICDDWRSKSMHSLKEQLWNELVSAFTGLDHTRKKQIIQRAGTLHRHFRTRLRSMARDKEGNYSPLPPKDYKDLPTVAPFWKEFVEKAMNEEFQEVSKRNQEQAKAMGARYRKSVIGYARLREQIKERKKKAGENEPNVSRFELFECSRRDPDGKIVDPNAQHIVEEVLRISQTLQGDDLHDIGPNDLLARVMPHEHPGRLRGTGWGVTKNSLSRC